MNTSIFTKQERVFLDEYRSNQLEEYEPGCTLPFRWHPKLFVDGERQAESFFWALHYLSSRSCPYSLAISIATKVSKKIKKDDIKEFLIDQEPTESLSSECELFDAKKIIGLILQCTVQCLRQWAGPSSMKLFCYATAIKNQRRKMEDFHCMIPNLEELSEQQESCATEYYAVFDGHGGTEAASYAAAHLHSKLLQHSNYHTDLPEALKDSFSTTDESFLSRAKHEGIESGTTGVCCVIRDDVIYTGWLGDSQARVLKNSQLIPLSDPHRPDRQDERDRIEALGGCVVYFGTWRVNGTLAISRAIGDRSMKSVITSDADIGEYSLDGTEDALILGCDGFWDSLTTEKILEAIKEHESVNGSEKKDLSNFLVQSAKDNGSMDNITVVIVDLKSRALRMGMVNNRLTKGVFMKDKESNNNKTYKNICQTGGDAPLASTEDLSSSPSTSDLEEDKMSKVNVNSAGSVLLEQFDVADCMASAPRKPPRTFETRYATILPRQHSRLSSSFGAASENARTAVPAVTGSAVQVKSSHFKVSKILQVFSDLKLMNSSKANVVPRKTKLLSPPAALPVSQHKPPEAVDNDKQLQLLLDSTCPSAIPFADLSPIDSVLPPLASLSQEFQQIYSANKALQEGTRQPIIEYGYPQQAQPCLGTCAPETVAQCPDVVSINDYQTEPKRIRSKSCDQVEGSALEVFCQEIEARKASERGSGICSTGLILTGFSNETSVQCESQQNALNNGSSGSLKLIDCGTEFITEETESGKPLDCVLETCIDDNDSVRCSEEDNLLVHSEIDNTDLLLGKHPVSCCREMSPQLPTFHLPLKHVNYATFKTASLGSCGMPGGSLYCATTGSEYIDVCRQSTKSVDTLITDTDQMLHVLTGWSPKMIRKGKSCNKWTLALEVDGSAVF